MDKELELAVSLFSPVSELITGQASERFEAVFSRRGNDTLYAFAPGTRSPNQNIDILFGDIFDNSQEEFDIILNIQNNQRGGNPLLILERNIPSLGQDRYILGDTTQPYYTNRRSPSDLLTTNLFGTNEFAVIYDFAPTQDKIQLNGSAEDYLLLELDGLKVDGVSQPFFGEGIFSLKQGIPDLVGYVISKPEVELNLRGNYFEYAGNRPPKRPAQRRVEQLGGPGIDLGIGNATDADGNVYVAGSTTGSLQGERNLGFTDGWIAKYDRRGNQLFVRQIGTSANDSIYDVATDKDGNFYLAGVTEGNLFSAKQSSETDAWVAKYNSSGNLLWGRQFGANLNGAFSNNAFGLDVDEQGNVYASGLGIKNNDRQDIFLFAVQDDAWTVKFDTNGNRQWFTELGSFFFDEAFDVAVDKDGNSYAVGWTQGLVKESDPSRRLSKYDAWLAKLDSGGQVEWIQQLGSQNQGLEFAWGVDTDSKGNVYATGWTTGNLATGSQNNAYDIWLAKFRPDSTQEWIKQFGSPGDDGSYLADLKIDTQDNIYLSGYSGDRISGRGRNRGRNDAFVAKFDTGGNNQWVKQLGSSGTDYATGLSIDNNTGRVNVTGFTDGTLGRTNTEAVDAWFAQLEPQRGRLQRFTGSARGISAKESSLMNSKRTNLVTDERLPAGDNRIVLPGGEIIDLSKVENQLASIFAPNNPNNFSDPLTDSLENEFAPFLNAEKSQPSETVLA
jgi:hypothetical protein